jgi:3-hydroxyacyl-[acyl-carrier-protein] dehydratase
VRRRLNSRDGFFAKGRGLPVRDASDVMKFILIDQIRHLVPGQRIEAIKALTLAEEYLADHFPSFPVMPGVLVLEAMIQASAWLVRTTEDFAHSMIVLHEARNVTYKSFVAPGHTLEVSVDAKAIEASTSQFTGVGHCGETDMVKARWTLRHFNLADEDPAMVETDKRLIESARRQWALLHRQD